MGGAGVYRSLVPELGVGLRVDGGGIAGEDDLDGSLGDGTLGFGALSPALRYRPLQQLGVQRQNGNRGLYLEFAGGLGLLEDQIEPVVAPAAGYIIDAGDFGIGPTARYLQVVTGGGDVPGGEDVRIMTVGLELVFLDQDASYRAPPEEYIPERVPEPSAGVPRDEVQSVAGADEDSDAVLGADGRMLLDERVFFGYAEASLRPEGKRELDRIAQLYKDRQPGERWATLRISGHADQRGPESYNLELSRERAENVRAYLTSRGVPASIIDVRAYGEERPVVPDPNTPADYQQNRRVQFEIVHGRSAVQE
jgi:outer membrane protein OmpA-like peptidoglycan-associated protein